MPPLSEFVNGIRERHGEKKDLVLMDNNITASARYREVIAEIVDLGFERGATQSREGKPAVKRRVDFNQGVDARILAKSPMYLKEMAKVCISPAETRLRPHGRPQALREVGSHGGRQRDNVAVQLHALQTLWTRRRTFMSECA